MKSFAIFALLFPATALAEPGLPTQPYIYVQGRAEIEKQPDIVILRFSVVTRNPDQIKANADAQAKATKIIALLESRKIASDDIAAADLRSEPQYAPDETRAPSPGKVIGYVVTRPFVVKIRDLAGFPRLVDDIVGMGDVEFSGISGSLSKETEAQDELWAKALQDARERADKTLAPLAMKIDSVFAVSPVTFPDIPAEIFGSNHALPATSFRAVATAETTQYRLAPVTLTQSVHVIYLISPNK